MCAHCETHFKVPTEFCSGWLAAIWGEAGGADLCPRRGRTVLSQVTDLEACSLLSTPESEDAVFTLGFSPRSPRWVSPGGQQRRNERARESQSKSNFFKKKSIYIFFSF